MGDKKTQPRRQDLKTFGTKMDGRYKPIRRLWACFSGLYAGPDWLVLEQVRAFMGISSKLIFCHRESLLTIDPYLVTLPA
jgi:hypothetical protein